MSDKEGRLRTACRDDHSEPLFLEKNGVFKLTTTLSSWCATARTVLIELTIPWEGGMEAAHDRKRGKFSDLAAECRESG